MPAIISLIILAIAVSIDGFGVGAMYGLRKIKIPLSSISIISLWSGTVIFIAMQIGVWIARFFSAHVARSIGAYIIMGIGTWALIQIFVQKNKDAEQDIASKRTIAKREKKELFYLEIKKLGLVIQILKKPIIADVDHSGNISAYEATLLGLALSLDAFGAGIGAALIGYTPWITSIVIALASGSFLATGLRIGLQYADKNWIQKLSILPGCVLILIGLLKLM